MTTEAALQEMNRTLGGLIASVDNLRRDFATSDVKSDQRLANLHRRLDEMVEDIGAMEARASAVAERIEAIEKTHVEKVMPTVDKVRSWEQRGVGAFAVAGIAFTSFGVFIARFWHEIVAALTAPGK